MFPSRIWREMPQRYRLEAAICKKCGKRYYPPRLVCAECGGRTADEMAAIVALEMTKAGLDKED